MRTSALSLLTLAFSVSACGVDAPAPAARDALVTDGVDAPAWHHAPRCFSRIDLGTLGGASSDVVAINRRGDVVGSSDTAAGERHAYRWRRGLMIDLGTLGGARSEALALDDRGDVVGSAQPAVGLSHAFVWRHGVMTDLSPDAFNAVANDINDRGQIVGTSSPGNLSAATAILWQDGAAIDLGAGHPSGALRIDARGDILGDGPAGAFLWRAGVRTDFPSDVLDGLDRRGRVVGQNAAYHAFVWQDGVSTDLGTLGGAQSAALASNGRVLVGWAETATGAMHAVLWRRGAIRDLHALGDGAAMATGVNARGDVVGRAAGLTHAFFWSDGRATDLGPTIGDVVLDDAGEVAGTVDVGGGAYHAVLWRPRCCDGERAPAIVADQISRR